MCVTKIHLPPRNTMGAGAGSGVVRGTSLGVFGHPAAGEGEAPRLVHQCLADAQQVTKEVRTHHFAVMCVHDPRARRWRQTGREFQ